MSFSYFHFNIYSLCFWIFHILTCFGAFLQFCLFVFDILYSWCVYWRIFIYLNILSHFLNRVAVSTHLFLLFTFNNYYIFLHCCSSTMTNLVLITLLLHYFAYYLSILLSFVHSMIHYSITLLQIWSSVTTKSHWSSNHRFMLCDHPRTSENHLIVTIIIHSCYYLIVTKCLNSYLLIIHPRFIESDSSLTFWTTILKQIIIQLIPQQLNKLLFKSPIKSTFLFLSDKITTSTYNFNILTN